MLELVRLPFHFPGRHYSTLLNNVTAIICDVVKLTRFYYVHSNYLSNYVPQLNSSSTTFLFKIANLISNSRYFQMNTPPSKNQCFPCQWNPYGEACTNFSRNYLVFFACPNSEASGLCQYYTFFFLLQFIYALEFSVMSIFTPTKTNESTPIDIWHNFF